MDVFIPIHYACHFLRDTDNQSHCPILCDLPQDNPMGESFLYLDTNIDDVDFDISVDRGGGLALTEPAFHHARRLYEDTTLTHAEDYSKRGLDIASSLHFGSAHEYLAAWMNETRKQAEFVRDIDLILSLNILKKLPNWMRQDLFLVIEAESMKHVFAKRFKASTDKPALPAQLGQAITKNATSTVHDGISSLLNGLFERPLRYNGIGSQFVNEFDILAGEYKST